MRLYDQYRAWVRVHSNSIAAFEGALSSLTWLLPDRFSDSELFLEALHSLLGFSSLFHDRILSTEENAPPAQQLPWPFWIAALQQVISLFWSTQKSYALGWHKTTVALSPTTRLRSIQLLASSTSSWRCRTDRGQGLLASTYDGRKRA